ncbi:MAG: hypothetical protein HOC20_12900 [Chloroflexi bacterium]|jgi:hypothetical protein|nr:hypothetical protein [Chloroflexota bacterium]
MLRENINVLLNTCDCALCRHKLDFEIPDSLIQDFISGNVVLFAGSGVSTESRDVLKQTLYDDIEEELGYEESDLSFPELMGEYCGQIDGRSKLLSKIHGQYRYIESFPEMYKIATGFHENLATLFPLKTIVTTNWDTYFEDVCNATPFVSDRDLAFWENPERRVLKIHGSINNYGSVVATAADYQDCQKRLNTGLIGDVLKALLENKTIVFAGYSFTDPNFSNILGFVTRHVNELRKQAFVITPIREDCLKFDQNGIIPINTDGVHFISLLKHHFVDQGLMLPDSIYCEANALASAVRSENTFFHNKYTCFDHPQMIYASCYQDGMIHALERVSSQKCSGEYSQCYAIGRVVQPYLGMHKEKLKSKKYEDVAYIEGYVNGLMFLLLDDKGKSEIEHPSLYYAFGIQHALHTLEDYDELIDSLPDLHKSSYKRAKKIVGKFDSSNGDGFHHPPWL